MCTPLDPILAGWFIWKS
uniref:Uncharacterized protein n=1 Tax=Arundo donax TaxID=35708 RepID=A0A0A8YQN7_ARUDO